MTAHPVVHWTDEGRERTARWRSERGAPPPHRVVVADDTMKADDAYALASQGVALVWRGDFQNARQMLNALATRADRKHRRPKGSRASSPPTSPSTSPPKPPAETFHLVRQARSQRARTLGMLLIPLDADHGISLRRAPDFRQACLEVYGPAQEPSLVSLRELLGVIGAHEWRLKGIDVPAAGGRIHPHYGVFAPIRSEYVDLVAQAPLPADAASIEVAFDIGTGTGVIAAVLARRGIRHVVATDQDPRALACARENIGRLGLAGRVDVVRADLFPDGRATLVVCNPPWLPARPGSPLERGIYDPENTMLLGFLRGLAAHLELGGEGWLILSDLAEHLGLRTRSELLAAFEAGGLKVVDRIDVRPRHPRAFDPADPLHAARRAEVTSLWRLTAR
ncbi:MAG: class I SAM-dependent methyltransferase [Burkholderiaceae bacterium]|nr:class I SAM-dependent methyltransferase [Burkholderiaceae bacterium]